MTSDAGGHDLLSQRKATCQIVLEDEFAEWTTPVRSMPEWGAAGKPLFRLSGLTERRTMY